jgi:hypothetical protein
VKSGYDLMVWKYIRRKFTTSRLEDISAISAQRIFILSFHLTIFFCNKLYLCCFLMISDKLWLYLTWEYLKIVNITFYILDYSLLDISNTFWFVIFVYRVISFFRIIEINYLHFTRLRKFSSLYWLLIIIILLFFKNC